MGTCLAAGRRDWFQLRVPDLWPHRLLRQFPGRHATKHSFAAAHPVVRSFEPGENWFWCYVDERAFEVAGAPPAPSHP